MRVIAGSAGGIQLTKPPTSVRPTMDKVKGAIFSSLGEAVPGARVLDLFAGSGAMGIEALSRGATSAVFVDENSRCGISIRDNLRKTKLVASVQIMDALRFLSLYASKESLDLIFADPPYSKQPNKRNFGVELLAHASLADALSEEGIFVLEQGTGGKLPEPAGLQLIRSRQYGESEVLYFRKA